MTTPIPWVSIDDLKNDQSLDGQLTDRDDEALQRCLSAAMMWVQRHRPDLDFLGPWTVPADVQLGTLRLAARWFVRRVSPDGMLNLGDMGVGQVMRSDPDIYLQLGIVTAFA